MAQSPVVARSQESALATNKVLRNTYALLSMTLLFSALMAAVSVYVAPAYPIALGATLVALGLLWFVLPRFDESAAGVGVVFAVTGLLGFGMGPMLSYYLSMANGPSLIATAMGGTGAIFLALSAYVLTTKKSFEFLGGMLFVGLMVVFGAMIANLFLQIPAMSVALSAGIVLLMSGFILFQTSRIINGGETNYLHATVDLFISIFNLFSSLLHLLGIMGDE